MLIVLALEVGSPRDAARDYAISVAAAFDAHLAAIGFDYAPVLPPVDTISAVPFDILDAERDANRKAASDAIARFEEAARLAAVSAESRLVEATVSGATKVLGTIARLFDLSVVGRSQVHAKLVVNTAHLCINRDAEAHARQSLRLGAPSGQDRCAGMPYPLRSPSHSKKH